MTSRETPRDAAEQIAKELLIAWLPHSGIAIAPLNPTKTGNEIGDVYRAVLAKVVSGPA